MDYPGAVTTETANLTTAKVHFNSVILTPKARFMTMDLKDFYLGTPMSRYKYMLVPVTMIPDNIIQQYNLSKLIVNGYVYVKICKGM